MIKKKVTSIDNVQINELQNSSTIDIDPNDEKIRVNISTKAKEDNRNDIHTNVFKTIVEFGSNIKNVLGQAFSNGNRRNNTTRNDSALLHNKSAISWRFTKKN